MEEGHGKAKSKKTKSIKKRDPVAGGDDAAKEKRRRGKNPGTVKLEESRLWRAV